MQWRTLAGSNDAVGEQGIDLLRRVTELFQNRAGMLADCRRRSQLTRFGAREIEARPQGVAEQAPSLAHGNLQLPAVQVRVSADVRHAANGGGGNADC